MVLFRRGNRKKSTHRTPLIWRLRARFADVAAIQERVTGVLRSIPKEAFADSFQKIYERCQHCVVKDGDYFEGQ
jgi:hypothetical protein